MTVSSSNMSYSNISCYQWLTCLFVLGVHLLVNAYVTEASPVGFSCETVDCGPGRECHETEVPCDQPPCQTASCRPSCDIIRCQGDQACTEGKCVDRCNITSCGTGSYCQAGICVQYPTCENTTCEPGDICVMQTVQCFTTPCPPIPTCIDQCATVRCRSGFTCLKGTCRPINITCATINCLRGYICVDNKCIPEPTCTGFDCEPGYECYLRRQACDQFPCLAPTPECRSSCALKLCEAPSNCVDGECVAI